MHTPTAKPSLFSQTLKIAVLSVVLALVVIVPALAAAYNPMDSVAGPSDTYNPMDSVAGPNKGIDVNAKDATAATNKLSLKRVMDQIKTWAQKTWDEKLKIAGDVAWKAALKNFLNTLAYDMATYLATGDKGQLPMFQTQGWGGYLSNVADNAAGTFIEQLGKGGAFKFNLCNPDFNVMLKINLGLVQSVRPKAPACSFSQMTKNWDAALKDKNFLPKFQDMFNPWSNDLGIALTVQTGMETAVSKGINAATQDRIEGKGWLSVRDLISGNIKTPAAQVGAAAANTDAVVKQSPLAYTGSAIADSIDIFINTLAGKMIEKWLKGGLVTSFPKLTNKLDSLTNFNAQSPAEGLAGAQDRMKSIVEPNFKTRADYDILAELATCPDPTKAGPTNCVIDEKFRQAIEKKLTVGQALAEGYLNGNGIFGFTSDGLEPKFNEGYSYRSMIILRKYRIIPVGWEVAAQYIKDCQNNAYVDQAKCRINSKTFNVNGTKNLKNLVDCFKDAAQPWCLGLVDPDWVLEAPQNFCAREGAGPEILSQQVTGQGADSSLAVLRNDTYCADEQSVITEKRDGSPVYGYCTEERRKWDFNANSCAPVSNTCQTFGSSAGQTNSYLENTLDFGTCGLGDIGCQKYAIASSSSYNLTEKSVDWQKSTKEVYLNRQAEACDSSSEGCQAFIRLNSGGGANLLINADFEEPATVGGWDKNNFGTIDAAEHYQGNQSLKITNSGDNYRLIPIGETDYNLAGESYALSFYAKCASGGSFWLGDGNKSSTITADANNWIKYNSVYTNPERMPDKSTNEVKFVIASAVSASCWIDNIKLERSSQVTDFSDYGDANSPSLIHEKLMPDYLMSSCYVDVGDHYASTNNALAICSDFARKCKKDEVGCELYTSAASGNKIPAKTIAQDYCPAVCVGYNVFIQNETPFDSKRDAYFIPKTAKTCGAEAAGCDEFTNLEQATTTTPNVAENKEYYSSLRQCLKKSEAKAEGQDGSCGEFYTWEGSDESGFQLKVESLVSDRNGNPILTTGKYNDPKICDQTIYNSPVGDPRHNDDCRQLYSHAGTVFYALYANTKTCSENCHPYRLSNNNVIDEISGGITEAVKQCKADCGESLDVSDATAACQRLCSEVSCTASGSDNQKTCKQSDNSAIYCRGGGLWSADNNACIYMAIPGQGATCSAAQTGCREYTGNTGNNIRKIFTDDFGNGVGSWVGDGGSTVLPSSEALTLDANNKGSSLQIGSPFKAKRSVGTTVHKGLDYVLSFVAKAASTNSNLTVELSDDADHSQVFAASKASSLELMAGAWRIFNVNLTGLNHEAGANEILRLSAGSIFYIDNITLTEITDRYYLIKNSWQTPDSCDENLGGIRSEHYMLYCDQYTDRASKTQNLKQFNKLCSESAVGCELMIDTHNSSVADASYYKDGQVGTVVDPDLTVPKDSPAYVVYDTEKFCGAEDQGCERLGQAYKYETTTLYGDAYLKNNPDKYNQILCGADAVGCDVFTFSNGTIDNGEKYFKDPGDQVCEWRRTVDAGASESWLKKKVKRCDDGVSKVNGKIDASGNPLAPSEKNVCLSDANCSIVTGKDNFKCSQDSDCRIDNNCSGGKCSVTGNSCSSINDCAPLTKCVSGSCHYSCITDNNDYTCNTSDTKTLGLGGSSPIIQPAGNGWAGICPAADSGCTEYIDPVSKFNSNQIFNGSFQNNLAGSPTDGWVIGNNKSTSCPSGYCQSVSLEPNTAYRLGRATGAGSLTIDTCKVNGELVSALYGIKSDNSLDSTAQPSIKIDTANSKIFYYKGEANASCTITAENLSGAVELKKAVIDYQLAQNLDAKSCNGQVNTGQGCVLFNERSQAGAGLAALKWDADATNGGSPARGHCSLTVADCSVDLDCLGEGNTCQDKDSNIILKVAPDRVCDKWLACKSYIKDAKGNNVCFDVGLCDAVDASGNCQSFIRTNKANQVAGAVGVDISNLSGYSKVGISGGSLKTDYYPFGSMKQYGEVANVSNGGFEYSGANGYPVGWSWGSADSTLADKPWNVGIFSVVNNPIAVQSEGIGYAPEGASFLKLGSSYEAVSEQIDVIPGTDYTITAYVNTKNLKNGQAGIDIMDKDYIAGNGDTAIGSVDPQGVGMDWSFKMGKFKTDAGVSQIKIKLYSSGTPEGNFYFDDIKIRPALNSRTDLAKSPDTDWYTAQSCRLYPQSDSLSCDYYEDSGKRQKGWPGYCLEYDRRPGDPNTCLLWYPIDKVKGDGIEEGAGYLGKAPVYYCVGGKSEIAYEYRHAYLAKSGDDNNCLNSCPINYKASMSGCDEKDGNDWVSCTCYPEGKDAIIKDGSVNNFLIRDASTCAGGWGGTIKTPVSENDGWYPSDGIMVLPPSKKIFIFSNLTASSPKYTEYLCKDPSKPANGCVVAGTDFSYAKYLCTSDGVTPNSKEGCGSGDTECSCTLDKELYRSKAFCNNVVQTVSPAGQNKYWSSRVYEGSDYTVDPSGLNYKYGTDATPFGSMVPPSSNPYDWDGQPTKDNNQPIYYSTDKTIIRSGKGYGCTDCNFIVDDSAQNNFPYAYENLPNLTSLTGVELVKSLFAQSYGAWDWTGSHYEPSATIQNWSPPTQTCQNPLGTIMATRSIVLTDYKNTEQDYCAIPPKVTNIQVNGSTGSPMLINSQFIKLSFNSTADSQQLPLVMYGVDWGDGSQTIVTGVEMRDKPNSEQPEIIYHLYSYWDLKATENTVRAPANNIDCSSPGQCTVQPKIQIRDNWGWCNLGASINTCGDGQWDYFGGSQGAKTITVKEKGTPESGLITSVTPTCGDNRCDAGETITTCPGDCSTPPVIPATCVPNDGACPVGCTNSNDNDCQPAAITGPAVPKNIRVTLWPGETKFVKVTWDANNDNPDTYKVYYTIPPNDPSIYSVQSSVCANGLCSVEISIGSSSLNYFSVTALYAPNRESAQSAQAIFTIP